MLRNIKIFMVVMFFVLPLQLVAQEKTYSAKEALSLFKEGAYVKAEEAYAYLLKRYDRELKYNYYYGICLIQNNNDIPQAVKRLKYAALKGVSRDAFYYLGRAYQLSYQFEEAISQYNRFLKYASASDIRNEKAEKYKQECEVGIRLSAKVYHLDVYSRDTVPEDKILQAYHPVKDVGRITRNSDFFESGLDPNGILYLTERGDEVYFTLEEELGTTSIFKMEKLLDGWSEKKALEGVNTASNESHPYVIIDGSTLYFSSNREGGIGGYDLYKANYDSESKMFSDPVNLGVPFNSPKDDYLFVADEFNSLAWFASNRETNDSTFIVYAIRWDDSVVKDLVQDMNEIKDVAAMVLTDQPNPYASDIDEVNGGVKQIEDAALFHFLVADTLEYSDVEHFNSDEARAFFEEGLTLVNKKDSLSNQMIGKREMYARTNSDTQRSQLVNDILSMEKQVYGLDEQIERSFYQARSLELIKVKQLVKEGRYSAPNKVKMDKAKQQEFEKILIPENFTFYTDQGFAQQLKELEEMYSAVFDVDDILKLRYADSLFVWGNILTLESSKMLESANNEPAEAESLLDVAFRKKDSLEEENVVANKVQQAKELKHTALKLYHESLDSKQKVYEYKMRGILVSNTIDDLSFLQDGLSEGKEYFRKAVDLIDPVNGFDMERYERSGAIKRSGIQVFEEGLFKYVELKKESHIQVVPEAPKMNVPKTYQELQGGSEVKQPAKIVEQAFAKTANDSLIFKIQIGVFRNKPDQKALNQISPISKIEIKERDLTKYFAGKYASYSDAQKDLIKVRELGFDGAFVVVFKDGKQINLTEDLKD